MMNVVGEAVAMAIGVWDGQVSLATARYGRCTCVHCVCVCVRMEGERLTKKQYIFYSYSHNIQSLC